MGMQFLLKSLLIWSLEGEKKSQNTATTRLCLHLKWKDFTTMTWCYAAWFVRSERAVVELLCKWIERDLEGTLETCSWLASLPWPCQHTSAVTHRNQILVKTSRISSFTLFESNLVLTACWVYQMIDAVTLQIKFIILSFLFNILEGFWCKLESEAMLHLFSMVRLSYKNNLSNSQWFTGRHFLSMDLEWISRLVEPKYVLKYMCCISF